MNPDTAKPDATPPAVEAIRAIKAVCPKCHRKYRLDERYAGRNLKCRVCGEKFEMPQTIQLIEKPQETPPNVLTVLLRRLRDLATGNFGKRRFTRKKWLSDKQNHAIRWVAITAAALAAFVGGYLYFQTDSAKIAFGTQAGKEIAFRRIVDLEEELAAALADIRKPADAVATADRIDAITDEQLDLWERLSEWKIDGFLTAGELNQLRTRFRDRYKKATEATAGERKRIGQLKGVSQPITDAFRRNGADLSTVIRLTLGGMSF